MGRCAARRSFDAARRPRRFSGAAVGVAGCEWIIGLFQRGDGRVIFSGPRLRRAVSVFRGTALGRLLGF